jgi:hypothetical protein
MDSAYTQRSRDVSRRRALYPEPLQEPRIVSGTSAEECRGVCVVRLYIMAGCANQSSKVGSSWMDIRSDLQFRSYADQTSGIAAVVSVLVFHGRVWRHVWVLGKCSCYPSNRKHLHEVACTWCVSCHAMWLGYVAKCCCYS